MISSSASPLVYVVVLNWKSADHTIACVETIEKSDYPNFKIMILDNDSRDGSEAVLKNRFSSFEFIQTGKNLGYGGGNNRGIRHALNKGADFVWIVNPDVRVSEKSLSEMIRVMHADASVGICSPRIIWESASKKTLADGLSFVNPETFEVGMSKVEKNAENDSRINVKEVDSVIGCSMLVRSDVFRKAGLFREDFFMYYEEIEFNLRARNFGWKTLTCEKVQDRHLRHNKDEPSKTNPYLIRNRILIARIQKKFILSTALRALPFKDIVKSPRLKNFRSLGSCFAPVIAGLIMPLKPAPRLNDAQAKKSDYPSIAPVQDTKRPFWSVMIPTMERPHYLELALKSVLEQGIPEDQMQIEVIGDEITSESTQKLVENMGKGRVAFYRQTGRKTQAEQWTACIRRARGRWVHIFHDDDVLAPGFYQAYHNFALKYPQASLLFCRAYFLDEKGNQGRLIAPPPEKEGSGIVENALKYLAVSDFIVAPSAVVKREVYEEIGGPDPELHYVLDWELFFRVAAKFSLGYIHEPYIFYRRHEETVSTHFIRNGKDMDEREKMFRRFLPALPAELRGNIRREFLKKAVRHSLSHSHMALQKGNFQGAVKQAWWAFRLGSWGQASIQLARIAFITVLGPQATIQPLKDKIAVLAKKVKVL
jgi:GT2 family glycosyltransferase